MGHGKWKECVPCRSNTTRVMFAAMIVEGEIDSYLGKAARLRACSHGGSHTILSHLVLELRTRTSIKGNDELVGREEQRGGGLHLGVATY
ncbi:hypothetical protein Tco_0745426 [Tanacetum coccineum]